MCCYAIYLHFTESTKTLSKLRHRMTMPNAPASPSSAQNNNLPMVDKDTAFADIADPPTDVDFLGELIYFLLYMFGAPSTP